MRRRDRRRNSERRQDKRREIYNKERRDKRHEGSPAMVEFAFNPSTW